MTIKENGYRKSICVLMIFLSLASSYFNIFDPGKDYHFDNYSERLIEARIMAGDDFFSNYGYGNFEDGKFVGCFSTWALQGRFFSFLYNNCGIADFDLLNFISCLLYSVVNTILCLLLIRQYGILFSCVFFVVSIL